MSTYEVEKAVSDYLQQRHPDHPATQIKGYSRKINVQRLSLEHLRELHAAAQACEIKTDIRLLEAIIKSRTQPHAPVKMLRALPDAVKAVVAEYPLGWVFKDTGYGLLPYLVTSAKLVTPSGNGENYVSIEMTAHGLLGNLSLHINTSELQALKKDATVTRLLLKGGFLPATPELVAEYREQFKHYEQLVARPHELLDVQGAYAGVRDYTARPYTLTGQAIVDFTEPRAEPKTTPPNLDFWATDKNPVEDEDIVHELPEGFGEVPFHPLLPVFDLARHTFSMIHARHARLHQWRKDLADSLILPELHRELINILTHDIDILKNASDLIEGKNEGVMILCIGKPGLGKTLTAEIQSELTERPLYRVHSGQLGLDGEEVEKRLEIVFKRAHRWNAVLLIDEADIFIRQRGEDMNQNAVVASFLRTIEYFSGLLFMTTNREDIDDAILSRAAAQIRYETPLREDAQAIWTLHARNLEINLDVPVTRLTELYPRASGRDILNLLKLTNRYASAKGMPVNEDAFMACAPFRGMGTGTDQSSEKK